MKKIILIFLLITYSLLAQTDWIRWEEKHVTYELQNMKVHDYTIDKSNFGMTILSLVRNIYYFFISDLDGDNCPFTPTCSAFFVQSLKETNIVKGTLMFADRFTRDLNFFKGSNHYKLLGSDKFFDPAYNYTLHSEKIKL